MRYLVISLSLSVMFFASPASAQRAAVHPDFLIIDPNGPHGFWAELGENAGKERVDAVTMVPFNPNFGGMSFFVGHGQDFSFDEGVLFRPEWNTQPQLK